MSNWFTRAIGRVEVREASPGVIPPSWEELVNDVTADKALTLATVNRCVALITTAVSQLTFSTYRGTELIESPLVVVQPDNKRSLSNFLKRTTHDLAVNGNAYWKTSKNGQGYVNGLEVLDPTKVSIERTEKGAKRFKVGDRTYNDSQVVHLRLMEHYGTDYGLSPIGQYKDGLSSAIALRKYAGDIFNNGVPPIYLGSDQEIEPELAAAIESRWVEKTKDGKIPVVGKGLKPSSIGMSLQDLMFIEAQNLSDVQIARVYGVDGAFLGLNGGGSSLTYTNRVDLDIQLVRYTLMQYLMEIEGALSSVLPRGTTVKFNVEDWLRAYEGLINPKKEALPQSDHAA